MSREYFGTDGIRGEVGGPVINPAFALRLGYAAGKVIAQGRRPEKKRPVVLIGKDTRISGYMLESALEAGFSAAGVDVLLAGPMPTPAVAYLTRALRLAAGVVISASHNPYYDNGIKFFSSAGMKMGDEVELQIEQALSEPMGCVNSDSLGKARRLSDAAGRYIEFCKNSFPTDLNLDGLRIVVDAAHGAAYQIAPSVFQELGAKVIAIGCSPDGMNINDGVGATHVENLVAAVREHRADIGLALDGDADRLQVVDAHGRVFNGDELLYLIVAERLQRGPVAGVVGTLMTNLAFEHQMQELGVEFARAAVGDRHVLEMMLARGWQYGGESSGHLLCLDRHTTGDGIIAALQVLAATQRSQQSVADMLAPLRMYPQKLVNVPWVTGTDWKEHEGLRQASAQVEQTLTGRGRVLIRASGTEPKLRLMVEAVDESLVDESLEVLVQSLATPAVPEAVQS